MTAIGYRPYPPARDVVAAVSGRPLLHSRPPPGPIGELPALVTADWCPFTVPATRFWREAADAVRKPLRVLHAETDDGARVMDAARVAGVPCVVAAADRLVYGYHHTPLEAQRFLTGPPSGERASAA